MNPIDMLLQFFAGMAVLAVACAILSRIGESAIDWLPTVSRSAWHGAARPASPWFS